MARENKLKGLKRAVTENTSVAAMENYISQTIEESHIDFDYNSLDGLNEVDIKNLKNYEQALLHEGKRLGTVALEIGKNLVKAREIFIKSHADSFVSWYEALGLTKDLVTVFTSRYKLCIDYPEQKDTILGLSDRMIRETINKKNPSNLLEKVFSGELRTALDIKKERENNSIMIEKFQEIEEAEIVPAKTPHSKLEKVVRELEKKISDIEIFAINNEGVSEEVYCKLKEALNILKYVEVK